MFLKKTLALVLVPIVLALAMPAAVAADTGSSSQGQTLSLTKAIAMAENSSTAIQADQVTLKMDANNSNAISSTATRATGDLSGLNKASITAENDFLQLTADENNTIWQTQSDYFAVQDAVYSEALLEKTAAEAQVALGIAQAELQVGTGTATQVSTAQATLAADNSKVTAAQEGVAAAYVAFDNEVGLAAGQQPDLTTIVTYDPKWDSLVANADEAASLTLQNDPTAQKQNNLIQLAKMNEPYEGQNGGLAYQAQTLASQTVLQGLDASAREYFLKVGADELTYEADQSNAIAQEANYSNAQASYKAGIITKDALLLAELGNMGAQVTMQKDLHTLLNDKAYLAMLTGMGTITIPVSDGK